MITGCICLSSIKKGEKKINNPPRLTENWKMIKKKEKKTNKRDTRYTRRKEERERKNKHLKERERKKGDAILHLSGNLAIAGIP